MNYETYVKINFRTFFAHQFYSMHPEKDISESEKTIRIEKFDKKALM